MTSKINVIVPVAPGEPADVIQNSIDNLNSLEVPEACKADFYYVIDSQNVEKDQRFDKIDGEKVEIIAREPENGSKAGAINEVLYSKPEPDFVSIFDVDSRPADNFLKACLEDLKNTERGFMSSAPRKVINSDKNRITKLVETEFLLFKDFQRIFDKIGGFNHFNGPIAVIDGKFAVENGFDEEVVCEDTAFSEEGYIQGKRASITFETEVGEQAVNNIGDLYSQKVRWMAGAREGLENYFVPMMGSNKSIKVKLSWFQAMFLPFLAFLFSPMAFIYGLRLFMRNKSVLHSFRRSFYLFLYSWFVSFCGLVALEKRITGEGIDWTSSERENL